ncbi:MULTISPECIES: response regulator [unclassified Sphingobacterium]|uniref:response regulator n=1 Tax=unclassified Sphingobacterium TaxID=2609468 RepID=UPI0025D0006E|nr:MULTISPECIES: response regulator [unclassified Sphingobacterium]
MDSKLKLAFVDDNVLHVKVIEHLAREMGNYEMLYSCHNGKELVHLLEKSIDHPDVCILDLHMPEMDGMETARLLRRRYPMIRLFGYSASESADEKKRFLDSGVKLVFSKQSPRKMLNSIYHYTMLCENLDIIDFEKNLFRKWNFVNQL